MMISRRIRMTFLAASVAALVLTGCNSPGCAAEAANGLRILHASIQNSFLPEELQASYDFSGCDSGDGPSIAINVNSDVSMPALAKRLREHDSWQQLSPDEAKRYRYQIHLSEVMKKSVQGRWVVAMFGQRGDSKEIDIQFE
ncbi:hypothetical protein GCM10009555_053280 [Acrocarpospora macrocephala]|uniref:Lipoprotein n=1 Tax=Acrocarpospora macrocephala TaxID=150177 RepID=A0A5M3WQ00_9ACTN|nr:hypothetical protein [Acrocarpospora macrocephala]GES11024.1 hypothetical protein Amac_046210 [Acrocarpospora macrocephala]